MERGWVRLGCIPGIRESGQKKLESLGEASLLRVMKATPSGSSAEGDMVKLDFRNKWNFSE